MAGSKLTNPLRDLASTVGSAAYRATAYQWGSMKSLAALLTDRRWAAPLSAITLGFGLFIGVAIGPAAGSFGTNSPIVIELPGLLGGSTDSADETAAGTPPAPSSAGGGTQVSEAPPAAPVAPAPSIAPALTPVAPTTTTPVATTPTTPTEPTEPTPTPTPKPKTYDGTVIRANPLAGSYVLALGGGQMYSVHATDLPDPGDTFEVPLRTLFNLTYAEDGERDESADKREAEVGGIVTYQDPAAGVYTVSRRGASVLVHVPAEAASEPLPAVGSLVNVTVKIEKAPQAEGLARAAQEQPPTEPPPTEPPPTESPPAEPPPAAEPLPAEPDPLPVECGERPEAPNPPEATLTQVEVEVESELTYTDIQGIVQGVCPSERRLVLSADDLRESAADISLSVPAEFDLEAIEPGDVVVVTALIGEDGSFELSGIASDERISGAQDEASGQGDLAS